MTKKSTAAKDLLGIGTRQLTERRSDENSTDLAVRVAVPTPPPVAATTPGGKAPRHSVYISPETHEALRAISYQERTRFKTAADDMLRKHIQERYPEVYAQCYGQE